jgi:ABC-type Na+ efflux pump permease subunit
LGYLIAPLFLIIPLMVSAVLAADAFAGEKERRTIETLLHLPISNRDLYLAKLLSAFIPAVAVSWIGFACYLVVGNASAWPVMHRLFLPTWLWTAVILWLSPAVAAFGLGIMVRVSARARTSQEANQLGGTVILPLVLAIVAQTSVLLLAELWVTLAIGALVWAVAIALNVRGAKRFARDTLATKL